MGMYLTASELRQVGFRSLGKRCLIDATAILIDPSLISIDDDVRIDAYVLISAHGGEVTIGKNVHIAVGVVIYGGGGVSLGDGSGLSAGVKVVSASDDYVFGHLTNPTIPDDFRFVTRSRIKIGPHAVVGVNSVLLPGSTLGFGSAVAAQTLVKGQVGEFELVGGSPMRQLGHRDKSKLLDLHAKYLSWMTSRES
jgi:galactoside O-acetyltransferase